jgi:hypothetical protein
MKKDEVLNGDGVEDSAARGPEAKPFPADCVTELMFIGDGIFFPAKGL